MNAAGELQLAGDDVRSIVTGVPPSTLGGGRLRAAVESLAGRRPTPCSPRYGTLTGASKR
jgi:hypothetical protein